MTLFRTQSHLPSHQIAATNKTSGQRRGSDGDDHSIDVRDTSRLVYVLGWPAEGSAEMWPLIAASTTNRLSKNFILPLASCLVCLLMTFDRFHFLLFQPKWRHRTDTPVPGGHRRP